MNSNLMVTSLEKKDIDVTYFFADFLEKAVANDLIPKHELMRIQQELIILLHQEAERYSFGDSSLPLDDAQILIESIEYTLGFKLKEEHTIPEIVTLLQENNISALFTEGQKLLQIKLEESKKLYQLIKKTRMKTSNLTYNAMIQDAIPAFLKKYQYDEQANNHLLTFDYPVYLFERKLVGIEAVYQFMTFLLYENLFLRSFDAQKFELMLQQNIPIFSEQVISLYQLGLIHFLLSQLIDHDNVHTAFSLPEVEMIQWELAKYEDVQNLEEHFIFQLNNSTIFNTLNKKVRNYIYRSLPIISEEIFIHNQTKQLSHLLLVSRTS